MRLSLFAQLYLGIISTLCITGLVITLAISSYLEQDELNDFIIDIQHISTPLYQALQSNTQHPLIQQGTQTRNCTDFCTQWLDEEMYTRFLTHVALRGKPHGISVYQFKHSDEKLAAVYPIPAQQGYLLITDLPQKPVATPIHTKSLDHYDFIAILPLLWVLLGALSCAAVLYFLSARIERSIKALQGLTDQYGAGITQRADENLPHPIGQLAKSFNQMTDKLDAQQQEQKVMNHAIAHELRTPLARMRLALGMINPQQLDSTSQALLDNLDHYISDMDELTQSVLSLGRITETQLQPNLQTINFGQFIKTRINSLSSTTTVIQHELDDTIMLEIVPAHLQLVIDNLINNALHYAHHQVQIQLQRFGEQGFVLKVSDDGDGIDEKDKLRVFMPFYRSDESRDRKTGGFGLGLALVQAVAKRYHWQVQATNQPRGGACFEVCLK